MLKLETTSLFRKDLRRVLKRGYNEELIQAVIKTLQAEKPLAPQQRDHALSGNYIGFRECHILPDWLLIYQVKKDQLILTASRTGTHADLFGK